MNTLTKQQEEFIRYCDKSGVLIFDLQGREMKSGRMSPRFFNAGKLMQTAKGLQMLSKIYVDTLLTHFGKDSKLEADILYGPAYKGIPLASICALKYFEATGNNIGFASHRKEPKDHGEGGTDFGMMVSGKMCLIIDDVITAGTAFRKSVGDILADNGNISGVLVLLDRQEVSGGKEPPKEGEERVSALQTIQREYGVKAIATLNYETIRQAIEEGIIGNQQVAEAMDIYQEKYGVR